MGEEEGVEIFMSTQQTPVITQMRESAENLTSGDLGVLGEVLGEDFGDFDVDLRSAGFEV